MSQAILASAPSRVQIHDSQFNDNSQTINAQTISINIGTTVNNAIPQTVHNGRISGLEHLLGHSIPAALHDASARDPPPRCHPGTRYDYIDRITRWGLNSDGHEHRMIWMYGPAGVGKSAVSQSCAEVLAERGKLGAAFFFSMPNKRDKPNFLFTTIAYQLAMKDKSCREIIDTMVSDDPTLVTKAIRQQFQDLIVAMLAKLKAQGKVLDELVIIVDGLDECADERAQCEIIEILAASVRDQTTPFLWVIVSRPEPHIQAKFTSPHISFLSLHIELPVSRDIDHEITKFLTDELGEIQRNHGLPDSWPSERQIGTLVNLSAGLFIYASTVVRFVKDNDSSGPDDQLQAVLALAQELTKANETHPLSELDFFYTLIMQRVPQKILPTIQKILLGTTFDRGLEAIANANVLGLSEGQFRNACRPLHSVLRLSDATPQEITFYHRSFMEYLLDPNRSRNLCIKTDPAAALWRQLFDKLNTVHAIGSFHKSGIQASWNVGYWPSRRDIYANTAGAFLQLCQSISLNHETLAALAKFNYAKIPLLLKSYYLSQCRVDELLQNIPIDFRGKIIRRYPRALFHAVLLAKPHSDAMWSRPYVLGHGKNKALLWPDSEGGSWICPYPKSHIASIAKFVKGKIMRSQEDQSGRPEPLPEDASESSHAES